MALVSELNHSAVNGDVGFVWISVLVPPGISCDPLPEDFSDDSFFRRVAAVPLTFSHAGFGFAAAIRGERTADIHLRLELPFFVPPNVATIAFMRLD